MHQPTRQLVHWHMFTNQQKLCTNRYIVMYANHISDKIFQKIKKKKRIKKTTMYIYWRSSVKTSDQRACHVIHTYLYKTC